VLVYSTLSIIEYHRHDTFIKKKKTLKRALDMLNEKYKDFLILAIFGSYAKGYATKSSDIDLLIVKNKISKNDIKKIENIIGIINARTGLNINPYLMEINEFKQKNNLVKEIIDNHIIIEGGELFFKLVLE